MKKFAPYLLFVLLCAAYANAGSLYSWSSGETLTHSQLNSNFSHIHNNMVGGHGARLVDADVASNAAISRSKLQYYGALPVAAAKVGSGSTPCASGTCTLGDSTNVTSVTESTSVYTVTWSVNFGDTEYMVFVTSGTSNVNCYGIPASATTATVSCFNMSSVAADAVFYVSAVDPT